MKNKSNFINLVIISLSFGFLTVLMLWQSSSVLAPSVTPTSTPTIIRTLPPPFKGTVSQHGFCYNGPNENYRDAIIVSVNTDVEVLAMNSDGDWFMIRGEGIDTCWIKASALILPPNIDLVNILKFITVITIENTPCMIYPGAGGTVQTVIPKDWRIVLYGKSDLEANWVLVVPPNSTEQCWVAKSTLPPFENFTMPIELVDVVFSPTPTPTLCIPLEICITETITSTPPFSVHTATPSLQPLDIVATEAKQQFDNAIKSNIAFRHPQTMKLGNTVKLKLLLSPLVSETQLVATLVVDPGLTPISTGVFLNPDGDTFVVESATNIESTNRMKAELKSQRPGAFIIERLHSDDIQASANGIWEWSVTAKEKGVHYLTLNIYMLYKVDGQEIWTQVESYEESIEVTVKPIDQISSLDWKWIVGILIPALFIPLFFRWYDKKKQKPASEKPTTKGKRKPKSEK